MPFKSMNYGNSSGVWRQFHSSTIGGGRKMHSRYRFTGLARLVAVFLLATNSLVVCGEETNAELARWGKSFDPDGDCKFFVSDGTLLLAVPGNGRPHDLAADVHVTNAPRVLQPVQGEFTIQVQIDGRFMPNSRSSLNGRGGYNGAGIVLMLDENNVVTLARATLQHEGDEEQHSYANFEMRVDGRLERIGRTNDQVLPNRGPLYLRLERRGQKVLGATSIDGLKWTSLPPKDLPEKWGSQLQTGVVAISTSQEEFNPRFSKLQLLK